MSVLVVQGRNRANRAGIEIRTEDGVLDESGNVCGHGIDPTGNVSDIAALSNKVKKDKTKHTDASLHMLRCKTC